MLQFSPLLFRIVQILFFLHLAVPDRGTFALMVQREQELEQSAVAQRALTLPCMDRRAARHQLHLRVVREVGLPDSATEVLQNAHFYYPPSHSPRHPQFMHLRQTPSHHSHTHLHYPPHLPTHNPPPLSHHSPRPHSHHSSTSGYAGGPQNGASNVGCGAYSVTGTTSVPMKLDLMPHTSLAHRSKMSPSHRSKINPPLSSASSYSPLEVGFF